MTTAMTAIADEATIRARLDEAQAVYPLPALGRVSLIVDRAAIYDNNPDIGDAMRTWARTLPPLLILRVHADADVATWAEHLGLSAPSTNVELNPDETSIWREVKADGEWLGWRVCLSGDMHTTARPQPLNIVRRAHKGVI